MMIKGSEKKTNNSGQKLVLILQRSMLILLYSLFGIQSYLHTSVGLFTYVVFIPLLTVSLFSLSAYFLEVSGKRSFIKALPGLLKGRWLLAGIFLLNGISICITFARIQLLSMEILWFVSTGLFFLSVMVYRKGSENRIEVLNDFLLGLILYVIINIGGHLAGLKNPVEELNYLRDFSSFFPPLFPVRVNFPFTISTRMLSITAGLTLTLSVLKLLTSNETTWKLAAWAGVIGSVIILMGSAARVPLVMAILTVGLILGGRNLLRWKNLAWVVSILMIAMPLLVVGINRMDTISSWAEGEGRAFQQQFAGIVSLTNRDEIWGVILDTAAVSPERMLAGYGGYGHLYSGASRVYGEFFKESYTYPNAMSAHNTVMQYLIDAGLIGVGVFILMFLTTWLCIDRVDNVSFEREQLDYVRYFLIIFLLFLAGSSTTETVVTYLSPISFSLMQFAVLYVIFLPCSKMKEGNMVLDV